MKLGWTSFFYFLFFFMPVKQTADGMHDKYAVFQ